MPARVKIGSKTIDIVRNYAPDDFEDDDNYETRGYFQEKFSRITIVPFLPRREARRVLAHELGHAVWDEAHIDPKLDKHEEKIVTATSPVWLATWRDNPALVRYLTERD